MSWTRPIVVFATTIRLRTVALILALLLPGILRAQNDALTPEARRVAVDSIAALVARHYVVPDTGRMIAEHLQRQQRTGAYQTLSTLPALAEALSSDLRSVNGDAHLTVRYDPVLAASVSESPAEDAVETARVEREMAERARRNNHGFARVEVLPGNVGHLKLAGPISGEPAAFERARQALEFIGQTDAVILDLRGVPGGSASMANFLISHFTEPDLPSLRIYWKPEDETTVRRTLSEVPGPRRTGVPLYVLVDGGSASAAEDIPFVLQNLGRATIVGETTAGAGRNNRYYPAGPGLVVFVSISRVQDPATGREWEQVGVIPDMRTPSEAALEAAHTAALERLSSEAGDEAKRGVLALIREYVQARYRPVVVPPSRLRGYAGTYEDGAEVLLREGEIHLRPRPDLPAIQLGALAESRFFFGPIDRVVFTRDARGRVQMEIRRDGRSFGTVSKER